MRNLLLTTLFLLGGLLTMNAQYSIVGKWKTTDDKTGDAKAIVEIKESKGQYTGKIISIFDPEKKDATCENCPGQEAVKKYVGLTILKNMVKDGDEYTGGTIMDPESGIEYKCTLKLVGYSKLEVKGSVSILLLGKSQTWTKQ